MTSLCLWQPKKRSIHLFIAILRVFVEQYYSLLSTEKRKVTCNWPNLEKPLNWMKRVPRFTHAGTRKIFLQFRCQNDTRTDARSLWKTCERLWRELSDRQICTENNFSFMFKWSVHSGCWRYFLIAHIRDHMHVILNTFNGNWVYCTMHEINLEYVQNLLCRYSAEKLSK